MADILDDLRLAIAFQDDHGAASGDTSEVMGRAIAEIIRLRALAGAVSDGESLRDIKSMPQAVTTWFGQEFKTVG